MKHDLQFIAISLGLINELLKSNNTLNNKIAIKYMDEMQKYGCKLRIIDGNVEIIDYTPKDILYSKL
jgi:hypothetical protein